MSKKRRYTVAVDFDGVLHSYTSPWVNARTIPDPPVPGALAWLEQMLRDFDVAIMSTRNFQWGGRRAMKRWLALHLFDYFYDSVVKVGPRGVLVGELLVEEDVMRAARGLVRQLKFPRHKPPALVYVDDRGYRFTGDNFPSAEEIHRLRPWNKEQL